MMKTAIAATSGELPPFVGGGVVVVVPVGVVVVPVGMVVGPVDGGDVDSEIGVGSAVGIPITQNTYVYRV